MPVSQGQQRGQPQAYQHQHQQHQDTMYLDQGQQQRPRSMYAPAHGAQNNRNMSHHQLQPSNRQFEGGQQGYYANNQQGAPMGADQGMHSNQTLTTAILPNGQTVYLNMTPYGYAPAQFQNPPPTQGQHMIHPQHQQVQGHDYMSPVPPMQTGGQAGYWQGGVEGGQMGQPPLLNQPVPMPRGSHNTSPNQHMPNEGERHPKGSGKSRRGGGGGGGQSGGRRDESRGGGGGGSKHSATSPLLDEFRATKNRDWTMLDIKGSVVEFCQDQNGSRFIQQRLEIGNDSEQQVVMAEVLPAVRQLRNDVFGNYVVQKLLEFGTHQMQSELRDTLKGEMLPLSLQMYGCRVVQKALETLQEDDLPKLLIEFHHNVLSCIHDQNGNHVMQKCIEVMSTRAKQAYSVHDGERAKFFGEQIDFIINDVLDNVTPLSCHPYGCRVLQRILEHCVEPKKILALDEIAKCHRVLLDDQYGNYVIQHVLQYGRHEDRESIMHIVIANGLLQLSKQKFASNVVEKLLKYGTPGQRNLLVKEMLEVVDDPSTGGSSVVLLMVRDAYANYVVQTTLDVVPEGEIKILLLEELNAHSTQLVSQESCDQKDAVEEKTKLQNCMSAHNMSFLLARAAPVYLC
jgi:pumilio RNA-binding family